MTDIDTLRARYEKAEQHAQKIMGDKDDALDKVQQRFRDRLREANQKAADAQKELLDAEVIASLLDRPDGDAVARSLVRQGGLSQDAVEAAFPDGE